LFSDSTGGGHLRFAYATIKINLELERSAIRKASPARSLDQLASFSAFLRQVHPMPISPFRSQQAVEALVKQDRNGPRSTM